jgi:hypothetical protein
MTHSYMGREQKRLEALSVREQEQDRNSSQAFFDKHPPLLSWWNQFNPQPTVGT